MRKPLDRQQRLDCAAVKQVPLNAKCRDEIVPILRALQHLYSQPQVRDAILRKVAADVNRQSSRKRGRRGMDYWPIVVLAAVRLGCNLDYDKLQDLAEQHHALRQIMGIGDWKEEGSFDWRRLRDNLCLLHPETLEALNHAIVAEGHQLVPQAAQSVRVDSFVAQTNIHYPTESSLIRDGLRKILQGGAALATLVGMKGWRQHEHLYRKVKGLAREIDRLAARKGKGYQERLKVLYRELLGEAERLMLRADELRKKAGKGAAVTELVALDAALKIFLERTRHVCGTARRRVLLGETVPNGDKLFSVFEPHTQLYQRGKAGEPVQFGRQVLVYEDGAGFITHIFLLPRDQGDREVVVEQTRRLQKRLGGRLRYASFDRGFHSPENQQALAEIVAHPCLPMPGAQQAVRQEEEASVAFRQSRRRHPGVESAINALQSGNGLERCRDRTDRGFSRYIQLGALGRNLQVLGKILLAREDAQCQAARSRRRKKAA